MYSESQTYSNRSDRVAQLAEHWASIPKVVGSIPTVARHIFQACSVWTFLKLGKEMQINHHSSKERTKMSKIAKFAKNIALQSLQILYTFVLRAEIATIFSPNVVAIANSARIFLYFPQPNIFSAFYNISQPNFAILLILVCSFREYTFFCQVKKLVYNRNCLLQTGANETRRLTPAD